MATQPLPMDVDATAQALVSFVNASIMAAHHPMAADDEFESAGVDSMGLLRVLLFVEQEFGFWMPDDDFIAENLRSPRALAEYICRHASLP
jgi:acyl carrier protein